MLPLLAACLLAQDPTAAATTSKPPERPAPFAITVIDDRTGRGVPLVELRTVNNIRFVTDSAGVVAFDEPGLMGEAVHFSVRSFGYEFPADGFGIRGRTLVATPGGSATLKIKRINLAERLYRVTGGGIYRDSVLVGKPTPIREPLLDSRVLGQDSIQSVVLGGKILWFWGDTNRPGYPLGEFHMPGATSLLPSRGGLDPEVGINLAYYPGHEGFVRGTALMPGEGPTWLGGLTVLRDPNGRDRLFASYDKIRDSMQTYQRGLVEWDEGRKEFLKLGEIPLDAPLYPQGHPFAHKVGGVDYVYFAAPFPLIRVPADPEAVTDLSRYEAFSPYKAGGRPKRHELDRDASGRLVYSWKKATAPAGTADLARMIDSRAIRIEDSLIPMRDLASSRAVIAHGGSVNWNAYRKRWVAIFVEAGGSSYLGEVYFAEADTPLGPWVYARKIATHTDGGAVYSFYNPKHHAFLDKEDGRVIFFEGTYVTTFSGSDNPTPRYDYNQVMYKLDLGREEMSLPVPIYEAEDGGLVGPAGGDHPDRAGRSIAFFAPDRPVGGTVAVFGEDNGAGGIDLAFEGKGAAPMFYALPANAEALPATTMPLREFVHEDGRRHAYQTDPNWNRAGFRRTGRILGHVWRNPTKVVLPRE